MICLIYNRGLEPWGQGESLNAEHQMSLSSNILKPATKYLDAKGTMENPYGSLF